MLELRDDTVLSYGLPSLSQITSKSALNKERVATLIRETLQRCEPRLRNVRVIPVDNSPEFDFVLEGQLTGVDGHSVSLRILSPLIGGGLGAEVVVIEDVRR